jgi:hypothetical protein
LKKKEKSDFKKKPHQNYVYGSGLVSLDFLTDFEQSVQSLWSYGEWYGRSVWPNNFQSGPKTFFSVINRKKDTEKELQCIRAKEH